MIYRCYICNKIKVKKADNFRVVIRNDLGESLIKYICEPCGQQIATTYEQGKKEAEIEQSE